MSFNGTIDDVRIQGELNFGKCRHASLKRCHFSFARVGFPLFISQEINYFKHFIQVMYIIIHALHMQNIFHTSQYFSQHFYCHVILNNFSLSRLIKSAILLRSKILHLHNLIIIFFLPISKQRLLS